MVSVLASSVVDRGFDSRSDQMKDYKIGICCFSAKHAALMSKNKDWMTRNQDQSGALGVLVEYTADIIIIISSKCNLFSSWYGWKLSHLVLNNNRSNSLHKLFHLDVGQDLYRHSLLSDNIDSSKKRLEMKLHVLLKILWTWVK
jgi:hypothetical protein